MIRPLGDEPLWTVLTRLLPPGQPDKGKPDKADALAKWAYETALRRLREAHPVTYSAGHFRWSQLPAPDSPGALALRAHAGAPNEKRFVRRRVRLAHEVCGRAVPWHSSARLDNSFGVHHASFERGIVGCACPGLHHPVCAARTAPAASLQLLDFTPHAVSADGSVVVGGGERGAVRWTAAGGTVSLGQIAGRNLAWASDVSADGSVVVGNSYASATPSDPRAFRWTASSGIVDHRDSRQHLGGGWRQRG